MENQSSTLGKLKVACLHGWGISPKFMEIQTMGLKKSLPYFEMFYLEAPYDVPPQYIQDEKVHKYSPDKVFKSWKDSITEDLLNQKKIDFSPSVEVLVDFLKERGDIDGVLAFSQAGFVVQQFLEKLEKGEIKLDKPPKFAMFVSVTYDRFISTPIKMPSIHIAGTRDDLLYGAGILNTARFLNPLVLIHNEGHKFPRLSQRDIDRMSAYLRPIRAAAAAEEYKAKAQEKQDKMKPKL